MLCPDMCWLYFLFSMSVSLIVLSESLAQHKHVFGGWADTGAPGEGHADSTQEGPSGTPGHTCGGVVHFIASLLEQFLSPHVAFHQKCGYSYQKRVNNSSQYKLNSS